MNGDTTNNDNGQQIFRQSSPAILPDSNSLYLLLQPTGGTVFVILFRWQRQSRTSRKWIIFPFISQSQNLVGQILRQVPNLHTYLRAPPPPRNSPQKPSKDRSAPPHHWPVPQKLWRGSEAGWGAISFHQLIALLATYFRGSSLCQTSQLIRLLNLSGLKVNEIWREIWG